MLWCRRPKVQESARLSPDLFFDRPSVRLLLDAGRAMARPSRLTSTPPAATDRRQQAVSASTRCFAASAQQALTLDKQRKTEVARESQRRCARMPAGSLLCANRDRPRPAATWKRARPASALRASERAGLRPRYRSKRSYDDGSPATNLRPLKIRYRRPHQHQQRVLRCRPAPSTRWVPQSGTVQPVSDMARRRCGAPGSPRRRPARSSRAEQQPPPAGGSPVQQVRTLTDAHGRGQRGCSCRLAAPKPPGGAGLPGSTVRCAASST